MSGDSTISSIYGSGVTQAEFKQFQFETAQLVASQFSESPFCWIKTVETLAQARHEIALKQGSVDKEDFGELINNEEYIAYTPVTGRYEQYYNYHKKYATDGNTIRTASGFHHLFELDSKQYELCSIMPWKGGVFWMRQPSIFNNTSLHETIIDRFRELVACEDIDLNQFVKKMGVLHYLLSRVVLAKRGSAWMYQTLMMAFAIKRGYSLSFNSHTMPDVLAIAHPDPLKYAEIYANELVVLTPIEKRATPFCDGINTKDSSSTACER